MKTLLLTLMAVSMMAQTVPASNTATATQEWRKPSPIFGSTRVVIYGAADSETVFRVRPGSGQVYECAYFSQKDFTQKPFPCPGSPAYIAITELLDGR